MEDVIIISMLFKIVQACVAFGFVWCGLRFLDKTVKFDFKHWVQNADDSAIAVYLGFRVLAFCLLLGFVISG